jgi:regulator of protease activity HflC (stomatin/prohibitin superfamily)
MLIQAFTVFLILALLYVVFSIRIFREYERGVLFFLGRFYNVTGPGLRFVWLWLFQMVRVDLRTVVLDVPTQDVISRDNVSVKVNAVIYFRVLDAERAIIQVENYHMATSQLAQTTLRSVLGQHELDEMLSEREKLNSDIQEILDKQSDAWGIKVSNVEIKHVDLDESMIRAIAKRRGGAHAARQDHRRRGRVAGLREADRGGTHHERPLAGDDAALPADHARHVQRGQQDDFLPAADRAARGVEGDRWQ